MLYLYLFYDLIFYIDKNSLYYCRIKFQSFHDDVFYSYHKAMAGFSDIEKPQAWHHQLSRSFISLLTSRRA
jgi:hypothetical protein